MKSIQNKNTLLLNSSWEPLTVISSKRAMILLVLDKAEYVEIDENLELKGPTTSFPMPLVIRLLKYVKMPYKKTVGLSRRAVITRDNHHCVYCGTSTVSLTLDHVIPRSRGGDFSWTNLVSSCF